MTELTTKQKDSLMCGCDCHEDGEPWCGLCFDTFPHFNRPQARTAKKSQTWEEMCMTWRGKLLTGTYAHCCYDYDELPVDETCDEWPCSCWIVNKQGQTIWQNGKVIEVQA